MSSSQLDYIMRAVPRSERKDERNVMFSIVVLLVLAGCSLAMALYIRYNMPVVELDLKCKLPEEFFLNFCMSLLMILSIAMLFTVQVGLYCYLRIPTKRYKYRVRLLRLLYLATQLMSGEAERQLETDFDEPRHTTVINLESVESSQITPPPSPPPPDYLEEKNLATWLHLSNTCVYNLDVQAM